MDIEVSLRRRLKSPNDLRRSVAFYVVCMRRSRYLIKTITTAQDFDAPASIAALGKYGIKFAFLQGELFEDRLNC